MGRAYAPIGLLLRPCSQSVVHLPFLPFNSSVRERKHSYRSNWYRRGEAEVSLDVKRLRNRDDIHTFFYNEFIYEVKLLLAGVKNSVFISLSQEKNKYKLNCVLHQCV